MSSVDSKISHRTLKFCGLINIAASIPKLAVEASTDLTQSTEASVRAGLTMAIIIPWGHDNGISDGVSLEKVKANINGTAIAFLP